MKIQKLSISTKLHWIIPTNPVKVRPIIHKKLRKSHKQSDVALQVLIIFYLILISVPFPEIASGAK